tara:strand:+ start:337 stop:717 length:381 start_codon:yes stop_codon:yes gene_type:complete
MSTLKVTNIQATGETATRPVAGIAGSFVNYDHRDAPSNTIRDSFNTSSLTDIATGETLITFGSAFANLGYTYAGCGGNGAIGSGISFNGPRDVDPTTSNIRMASINHAGSDTERDFQTYTFFGDMA